MDYPFTLSENEIRSDIRKKFSISLKSKLDVLDHRNKSAVASFKSDQSSFKSEQFDSSRKSNSADLPVVPANIPEANTWYHLGSQARAGKKYAAPEESSLSAIRNHRSIAKEREKMSEYELVRKIPSSRP